MMLLPAGGMLGNGAEEYVQRQPSRTYRIDWEKKRILGMTDGLEAVKQAVFKILQTERFEYVIYSFDYGSELSPLLGMDALFVRSELERRIREALMQDDRVTDIRDLQIRFDGDGAQVQFTLDTPFGPTPVAKEVTFHV